MNLINPSTLTNPKSLFIYFFTFVALSSAPCALAADFSGNLKSVSITEPSGTNKPPVAVIQYAKSGETFTFDASGSNDQDGSIVEYKWDFGDGNTGVGVTINHLFPVRSSLVTLTVVDNQGGVTLTQIEGRWSLWEIEDDFSTLASWVAMPKTSSMVVSDNKGTVSNTWSSSLQRYNAVAVSGLNQTAQVTVELGGKATNKGGVALRLDPLGGTYYTCYVNGTKAYINYYNGTSTDYLATVSRSFNVNSPLNVSCTITGTVIALSVDGTEYLRKTHSSAPSVGKYVGAYVGNDGSKAYVSQFKAKAE